MSGPLGRLGDGWARFWFAPRPTSTLAVFRIAFGLLATAWTVSLAPSLDDFFGPGGVLPGHVRVPGEWGLLELSDGRLAVVALFAATVLGGAALTVGWHSRTAAVVVFLGVLSFQRADPMVLNSGDGLIRNLALYCALSPTGAALSVDRWRADRARFWTFPERAPWGLRLIQVQLSVVYLSTVWQKVQGEHWRDGTAVSYALRLADLSRFPVPAAVTQSVVLVELLTFGTLALEAALAVLVWNRAARPWVLGAGVALHLGIEYSLLIGFFSLAVLTMYLAFVPPDTAGRLVLAVRDRARAAAPTAGRDPARPFRSAGRPARRPG